MSTSMFASNTLITGGSFHQHNANIVKGPFERLQEASSPAAFHNAADRHDPPKCHPNTRVAVLKKIMDWILGRDPLTRNALIAWLHGPAGSGKSAIAQSIAEWCYEQGILVASFFFSRFNSTRNHARSFIATIAYQASLCFPEIKGRLTAVIEHDPLLFSRSLDTQIQALVIQPFRHLQDRGHFNDPTFPRVIIIDGLDECEDREGQLEILSTISNAIQRHRLPLIFLIASRPEHDITTAFGMGHLCEISMRIPLDRDYHSYDDIELFLRDNFREIRENHPFKSQIPLTWPSDDILQAMVRKSSGQFIYASTLIKFVKSSRHRPTDRLDIALGIRPPLRDMPFAELDALYIYIFSCLDDPEPVLQVLASHIIDRQRPDAFGLSQMVDVMEDLLSLSRGDIRILLCDLTSLLWFDQGSLYRRPQTRIRFFHASLEDFLLDQSRSQQFYINVPSRHAEFAHRYIQCLKGSPSGDSRLPTRICYHIARAMPSLELRNDILEVTFAALPWSERGYRPNDGYCKFIVNALLSIKESTFEDAEQLSMHQQQLSFDHIGNEIIRQVYLEANLTALVSITRILVRSKPWHRRDDNPMDHIFKLDPDQQREVLRKIGFKSVERNYLELLAGYLEDERKSGIYALTGARYASATIFFLGYTHGHRETRSKISFHKYNRRRNTPWMWRQQMGKHSLREKFRVIRRNLPLVADGEIEPSIRDKRPIEIPAFCFALECLLHVIPRSGRSEDLINCALRHTFGPLS